jgi:hypothetical protein
MSPLADDLNAFRVSREFLPQDDLLSGPASTGEEPEVAEEVPEPAEETSAEPEIDLKALAEKVYALLRQEVRLERERLIRNRPW